MPGDQAPPDAHADVDADARERAHPEPEAMPEPEPEPDGQYRDCHPDAGPTPPPGEGPAEPKHRRELVRWREPARDAPAAADADSDADADAADEGGDGA